MKESQKSEFLGAFLGTSYIEEPLNWAWAQLSGSSLFTLLIPFQVRKWKPKSLICIYVDKNKVEFDITFLDPGLFLGGFAIHVVSQLFLRGFPESSSSEEEENLDDYEWVLKGPCVFLKLDIDTSIQFPKGTKRDGIDFVRRLYLRVNSCKALGHLFRWQVTIGLFSEKIFSPIWIT